MSLYSTSCIKSDDADLIGITNTSLDQLQSLIPPKFRERFELTVVSVVVKRWYLSQGGSDERVGTLWDDQFVVVSSDSLPIQHPVPLT